LLAQNCWRIVVRYYEVSDSHWFKSKASELILILWLLNQGLLDFVIVFTEPEVLSSPGINLRLELIVRERGLLDIESGDNITIH